MNKPIFITGISTGVGKTLVAAVIAEALKADYWKPIQPGVEKETDSNLVKGLISNINSTVHHEYYRFAPDLAPHIALRKDNTIIDLDVLERSYRHLSSVNPYLVIEGSGGLITPLNENEFEIDLVEKLNAKLIIVSRNYPGSINHSLMTAQLCRQRNVDVLGWVFTEKFMDYQKDIVRWSQYPALFNIPFSETIDKNFVLKEAGSVHTILEGLLDSE